MPGRKDDCILDAVRLEPETLEEHRHGQLFLAIIGTLLAELHPSMGVARLVVDAAVPNERRPTLAAAARGQLRVCQPTVVVSVSLMIFVFDLLGFFRCGSTDLTSPCWRNSCANHL